MEHQGWFVNRSGALARRLIHLQKLVGLNALEPLDDPENTSPEDRPGAEFFEHLKDLTIFGYYTSKIGLEQELEYGGDDYHTEFPGACTHPEHQT